MPIQETEERFENLERMYDNMDKVVQGTHGTCQLFLKEQYDLRHDLNTFKQEMAEFRFETGKRFTRIDYQFAEVGKRFDQLAILIRQLLPRN